MSPTNPLGQLGGGALKRWMSLFGACLTVRSPSSVCCHSGKRTFSTMSSMSATTRSTMMGVFSLGAVGEAPD
jgi:hypothetical protein